MLIHSRILRTLVILIVALAAGVSQAVADTVTLKDGTKLEGRVLREGDDFIYFMVKVGGIETPKMILRADIVSHVRDAKEETEKETPAAPGKNTAPASSPKKGPSASDGAVRVVFITLEDTVGTHLNADALRESMKLAEKARPDIVVLRFNSGGGALAEIQELSDVIQKEIKPKYRTVAWIESAISAASMTAITCEEIYFTLKGNFGGSVGFRTDSSGRATRVDGEMLEVVFRMMEDISRRGSHDPLIMRAMQAPTDLSCDIDPATGVVTWRNDLSGQHIVSQAAGDRILTLNSRDAEKYKLSRGTAETKEELAKLLQLEEWVEVAPEADKYQQDFRDNVTKAQVKINELSQKMQIAIQFGQIPRARAFLSEIRSWVRRATSLERYAGLDDDWFREREEELRKLAQQQSNQRR